MPSEIICKIQHVRRAFILMPSTVPSAGNAEEPFLVLHIQRSSEPSNVPALMAPILAGETDHK